MVDFDSKEVSQWELLSNINILSEFKCIYRKKIENGRIYHSCESILPISFQEAFSHIENIIEGAKYDDYIDKIELLKDGNYKIFPLHEDVTNTGPLICKREVVCKDNKCWAKNINTVNGLFHSLTVVVEKQSDCISKVTAIVIHLMTLYSNFNETFDYSIALSIHYCVLAYEKSSRFEKRKQSMKNEEMEFEKALYISTNEYPFIIHQSKFIRILLSRDKKKMVIQSEMRCNKRVEVLTKGYVSNKDLFVSQFLIKQEEFKSYYHIDSFDSSFDIVRMDRFNSEEGVALLVSKKCSQCKKQHTEFKLLPSGNKLFRDQEQTVIQSVYHIDLSNYCLKEERNYYSISHKALFIVLYGHALYLLLHENIYSLKYFQGISSNNDSTNIVFKTLELMKYFHNAQLKDSPFNFLALDSKIQLKICGYLQPKHLFALMQTNKTMRRLLQSNISESIWKNAYLKYQDAHSFNKINQSERHIENTWLEVSKKSYKRECNWFRFDVKKYICNSLCKPKGILIKKNEVVVGGETGIIRTFSKRNNIYSLNWSFVGTSPLCGLGNVNGITSIIFKDGTMNCLNEHKIYQEKVGCYNGVHFYQNIAIGWGNSIEWFDLDKPFDRKKIELFSNEISQIKLLSYDSFCISSKDEIIGYDIRCTRNPTFKLEGHLGFITDFDHFGEHYIISGSNDCSIRLWDVRNPLKVIDRPAHFSPIKAVNCYNRKIISVCDQGYVTLTECDGTHLKHCNFVSRVNDYSCSIFNDTKLVCGSLNGSIVIFEND